MQSARGNLEAALKAYQDSLAIREKLAAQDPSNTEWQRDLSVSFNKIGDVQRARGNLDAALEAYGDGLAIAEKLAAQDPSNTEWQRDLSVSFNQIGDVQRARGNLDAALKAYQDSLAIREKLAAQDPSNSRVAARPLGQLRGSATCSARRAIWTRALRPTRTGSPSPRSWPRRTRATPNGSATSRSASTRSATCRARGAIWTARSRPTGTALAIREKLAAQDPSNTGWQRDLSVSFERIGDVQSAQGNLEAALKAYEDELAIPEKLAAQDPSNTEWQRDLSVSFSGSATCRARGAIWTPRSRRMRTGSPSARSWPRWTRATPAGSATSGQLDRSARQSSRAMYGA